jgi:phosphoglycerate kinase
MYKRKYLNELIQQASISTKTDLQDKTILLRTCLNLPFNSDNKIDDLTRLEESYPTIELLAKKCKKLIVIAHLGRPIGKDKNFSLLPVFQIIQPKLNTARISSEFIDDTQKIFSANSKVCLLENIRFFTGEESENQSEHMTLLHAFNGVDYFVNDAFPDYRESFSTFYVTSHFKSFLGPNFIKEVRSLSNLSNPLRPYIALIGGSKLSEKLDMLVDLAQSTDKVLVGGGIAYTLLKAKGFSIGTSIIEDDKLPIAKEIVNKYSDKIVLPIDHLVSREFSESASNSAFIVDGSNVPG